jgi:hypothetical protein
VCIETNRESSVDKDVGRMNLAWSFLGANRLTRRIADGNGGIKSAIDSSTRI